MKQVTLAVILVSLLIPTTGYCIDELEFAFVPQGGYTIFFARMGQLVGPDICYGADFAYGILPWLALDFDIIYSEHQQANSRNIGTAQLNHLQTGVGPRFSYPHPYVIPYATAAFGGNFFRWENKLVAGEDQYDGNGMAAYLTLGLDFLVADGFTIGLAGKGSLASSDFEFVTNKDGTESISAYAMFSALLRFTLIF